MTEATAALLGDNGGAPAGAAPTGNAPAAPTGAPTAPTGSVWRESFDEDTQAYVQNKGWQSPADLLTSYRNLEKFAGGSKNLVELPGADADPNAWDSVYNKLGRPESPDKYGIQVPEGGDPELADWFKQTAHATGLTDRQAQTLFNKWNEMAGTKMQAMEASSRENAEKAINDLKREWGQTYDAQIASGRRAVAALGFKEDQLSTYEAKLGTADMLKLFATLGTKMGEPSFEGGERTGAGFGITPAMAQQQLAELKTDQRFMDAYMKGDRDAVGKMKRLMENAYG